MMGDGGSETGDGEQETGDGGPRIDWRRDV